VPGPDRLRSRALFSSLKDCCVVPNLDIYRAAKLLVDHPGEDAPIRAVERADELVEEGEAVLPRRLPELGGRQGIS
jgi:hypothetical protein